MEIPIDVDGVVIRGISGRLDDAYAPDTDDVIKILAEGGVRIRYADSERTKDRLLLKSGSDWWGPIVIFTQEALAHGAAALLAEAVRELLGGHRSNGAKIQLEVGCLRDGDAEINWLRGEGDAASVLEALRVWKGE